MISKQSVPFGGVFGWLADLTVTRKTGSIQYVRSSVVTESYFVAEPEQRRGLNAIRAFAKVDQNVPIIARRSRSRNEIGMLGLKPGQVRRAA
jgi:hypothetical protein